MVVQSPAAVVAIVEMKATNVCVYGAQGCLALQHLCACFERLGLARAWAARFVFVSFLGANA